MLYHWTFFLVLVYGIVVYDGSFFGRLDIGFVDTVDFLEWCWMQNTQEVCYCWAYNFTDYRCTQTCYWNITMVWNYLTIGEIYWKQISNILYDCIYTVSTDRWYYRRIEIAFEDILTIDRTKNCHYLWLHRVATLAQQEAFRFMLRGMYIYIYTFVTCNYIYMLVCALYLWVLNPKKMVL